MIIIVIVIIARILHSNYALCDGHKFNTLRTAITILRFFDCTWGVSGVILPVTLAAAMLEV